MSDKYRNKPLYNQIVGRNNVNHNNDNNNFASDAVITGGSEACEPEMQYTFSRQPREPRGSRRSRRSPQEQQEQQKSETFGAIKNGLSYDVVGNVTKSKNIDLVKYTNGLMSLKNDIIASQNRDEFLSRYKNLTEYFVNHEQAKFILFGYYDGLFGSILSKLAEIDVDILLYGSSSLSAVLNKSVFGKSFIPKDLDLCVKNITHEKIIKIDLAIKSLFPDYKIIIIRRPINLTWWVFDQNYLFVCQIQLNILNIDSWADIFITAHGDNVCIGYDVKKGEFTVLTSRWMNFVLMCQTTFMSNLTNFDSLQTLKSSMNKYEKRGFIIKGIITFDNIKEHDDYFNNKSLSASSASASSSLSNGLYGYEATGIATTTNLNSNNATLTNDDRNDNDGEITPTNYRIDIYTKLASAYKLCGDIVISDCVENLYDVTKPFPSMLNLLVSSEREFLDWTLNFEHPNGNMCCVLHCNEVIMVANRNCGHDVSLLANLQVRKFDRCPLCRASFDGVIYNCTTENRAGIFDKKIKSPIVYYDKYFDVKNNKYIKSQSQSQSQSKSKSNYDIIDHDGGIETFNPNDIDIIVDSDVDSDVDFDVDFDVDSDVDSDVDHYGGVGLRIKNSPKQKDKKYSK